MVLNEIPTVLIRLLMLVNIIPTVLTRFQMLLNLIPTLITDLWMVPSEIPTVVVRLQFVLLFKRLVDEFRFPYCFVCLFFYNLELFRVLKIFTFAFR